MVTSEDLLRRSFCSLHQLLASLLGRSFIFGTPMVLPVIESLPLWISARILIGNLFIVKSLLLLWFETIQHPRVRFSLGSILLQSLIAVCACVLRRGRAISRVPHRGSVTILVLRWVILFQILSFNLT
jgi:hypothetical protein